MVTFNKLSPHTDENGVKGESGNNAYIYNYVERCDNAQFAPHLGPSQALFIISLTTFLTVIFSAHELILLLSLPLPPLPLCFPSAFPSLLFSFPFSPPSSLLLYFPPPLPLFPSLSLSPCSSLPFFHSSLFYSWAWIN